MRVVPLFISVRAGRRLRRKRKALTHATLDGLSRHAHAKAMTQSIPIRRLSVGASGTRRSPPDSPRARILLALELGRRGQVLRQLNPDARPRKDARAR